MRGGALVRHGAETLPPTNSRSAGALQPATIMSELSGELACTAITSVNAGAVGVGVALTPRLESEADCSSPSSRTTLSMMSTPARDVSSNVPLVITPPPVRRALPEPSLPRSEKRIRLRGKQSLSEALIQAKPNEQIWILMAKNWQNRDLKSLETRIKTYSCCRFVKAGNSLINVAGTTYLEKKQLLQQSYYSIVETPLANKFIREQWWVSGKSVLPEYFGPAPEVAQVDDAILDKIRSLFQSGLYKDVRIHLGALLTYNDDYTKNIPAVSEAMLRHANTDKAAKDVSEIESVIALWNEFESFAKQTVAEHGYAAYSVAMEISLNSETAGRLHLHLYVSMHNRATKGVSLGQLQTDFKFHNRSPGHISPTIKPRGRKTISACVQQAMYYCQAPKIGQVFSSGSAQPFANFPVSSKMVVDLWKAHKMTTSMAQTEILKTRDSVPRWFQELLKTHAQEAERDNAVAVTGALEQHRMSAFKEATACEVLFLKQFGHLPLTRIPGERGCDPVLQAPSLRRYKFMVYDGKSRTGKTERAIAWWSDRRTLTVNAQGTTTPSLRDYDPSLHRAIVYDEGSWMLAAKNRMMFQSGPRSVKLAQSNCNLECYDILLYGAPQIITSNHFWSAWNEEDPDHREARDWLEANMHYVVWNAPTWEERLSEPEPELPTIV